MRNVIFLIVAGGFLFGCGFNSDQLVGRFTIVSVSDGRLIRVDTRTGEVTPVDIGKTKLIVNTFYEAEDGQVFKYVGQGKFELRPPLSTFFK